MTWADRQGIPTGHFLDKLKVGNKEITVRECTRATVYERRREGIKQLMEYAQANYLAKGVAATVFGLLQKGRPTVYAVFVEDGFLREVPSED